MSLGQPLKLAKRTEAMSKGLKHQVEEVSTNQRWDNFEQKE